MHIHWKLLLSSSWALGGKEAQAAKIGNVGIGDRRHLVRRHMIPKY